MKKTVLFATLFAAIAGTAQAYDSQGESINTNVLKVGPTDTNVPFHGPKLAPGIGFPGTNIISLSSITASFTEIGDIGTTGFKHYQLLGFNHGGSGPSSSININWSKVPATGKEVYFGIGSNPASGTVSRADTAWYVGDKEGFVVPTVNSSYKTVGFVTSSDIANPEQVIGTLNLVGNSLNGNLTDGSNTLGIATTVNHAAGTFNGSSVYGGVIGDVSGQFYGSGNGSAVAGLADGGNSYQAAFGGIKQ